MTATLPAHSGHVVPEVESAPPPGTSWVGRSVRRKEDRPLVTGTGTYVADIELPGMLEVAMLRSGVAHARIVSIDTSAAESLPGVHAVITGTDIADAVKPFSRFVDQEHTPPGLAEAASPVTLPCDIEVLPVDRVRYVGQAIAAVIATDRYVAEDALGLIEVEYSDLPVIVDPEEAIADGAPLLHEDIPRNTQAYFEVEAGDVTAAFAKATHTDSFRFTTQRQAGVPMETRGVVATFDRVADELQVWSSTQAPFMVRTRICEQLDVPEHKVRVTAPDVGGGFGPKVQVYPEEVLMAHLALTYRIPLRWIEDRLEHLTSTAHSRDQIHFVDVAYEPDGTVVAIDDRFLLDCGAYNPFSITCAYNSAAHFRSLYQVPHFRSRGECVLTNKTPNVPYRGAGRPEAIFAMDRLVVEIARKLGLDPVEVMRRNLVPVEDMPCSRGMPYRDGNEIVYDAVDFPSAFDKALAAVDYERHKHDQQALRERGVWRGIGVGTYVEGTGIGPFEGAQVELTPAGVVLVGAGSAPHGQSHRTTLAQIACDELGTHIDQVIVRAGDTAVVPYGCGTFASRSAVTAGSAVLVASRRLRERIVAIAATILGAPRETLELADSTVFVADEPDRMVTFAQIAAAAAPGPHSQVPKDFEAGIKETYYFVPPTVTFGYGFQVAEVEVDVETGFVDLKNMVIVHDCGRIIHPQIVDGQIQGGVAQGIGAALYEQLVYDPQGQPQTTTFMDYLLPTMNDIPVAHQIHLETPSERNPLGVKGVGEAGTISPPAAIANAVVDALAPLGVSIDRLPVTPFSVHQAIERARTA
ncbi:xanthine dehydrogenase family protein molybdopterin-binding subunit [Amycolatopsis methanolica]|uniref:Xanthine dehydrogenase, molybdenum binding subunit apoprotein n=1 Tax=Amycolatopsis methanolica 239 TaxID=1068978 RepID=A0A076MZW4_AMYME|nr:xanthine dehydrogenase family protein molybdopterin-binding subunit [Amycolatopsis methanolica]AIJ26128.1 xanthine dehydrogenase, molybdenum binding subunit apoprotein [Amycolatopsis methanolica 239]